MPTSYWELPTESDFIEGVTPYTSAQIGRENQISETQTTGALRALLSGRAGAVVARPDATSLLVTPGLGLSVTIARGAAIVEHPQFGACYLEIPAPIVRGSLPASSIRYLFAAFENTGGVDSRVSGLPIFVLAETQSLAGAVLLAALEMTASAVIVTDARGALLGSGGVPAGPSSGGATSTVRLTTSSLAVGARDSTKNAALGAACSVGRVATNVPAWVRLYPTAADRANDALRGRGNDPAQGVTVAFECVTDATQLTLNVAPAAGLFDPEADAWPASIVNLGSGTVAVAVDFTIRAF